MNVKKIHHINFLVKDLDLAVERYAKILGVSEFIIDELRGRGVKTARVALGEQWLVLVQPTDPNGIPGRHLMEHGEGFFLMSFEVENMSVAVNNVGRDGISVKDTEDRKGLENWWVRDVDLEQTFGAQIQFCEERD